MYNKKGTALAGPFLLGGEVVKKLCFLCLALLLSCAGLTSWQPVKQQVYIAVRATSRSIPVWSGQGWSCAESEHFVIYFQPTDTLAVAGVIDDLEYSLGQARDSFGRNVPSRIPVMIQPSMTALQIALGDPRSPTLGAYYLGRLQLLSPLAWQPNLAPEEAVAYYRQNGPVAHELAHLLLDYQVSGNTPQWFSEGMAQYFEWRIKGYTWEETAVDWQENVVPITQLDADFGRMPEYAAYRESLSVVQFLYTSYGADAVERVVTTLGQGQPFAVAVRSSLGLDVQQVSGLWLASLK